MRKTFASLLTTSLIAGALVPSSANAWIKSEEDLLSGQSSHYQFITSKNTVSNSIGVQETATLIIRCKAGKRMEIFVSTPTYNGSSNRVAVRWDEGEAKRQYWSRGSGGTAFFSGRPPRFLSKLLQHDRLVFAWDPYNRAQTAVAFDLASEKEDLNKMVGLCGVTPEAEKPKKPRSSGSGRGSGRAR